MIKFKIVSPAAHVCLMAALLIPAVSRIVSADTYVLRRIVSIGTPVVEKGKIAYSLDFVFYKAPANFWIYYSKASNRMAIDFYDCRIEGPLENAENALFKSVVIRIDPTAMALTGDRSQIFLPLGKEWHLETISTNSKHIRLKAWKYLKSHSKGKSVPIDFRSKSVLILALSTMAGATLGALAILAIAGNAD